MIWADLAPVSSLNIKMFLFDVSVQACRLCLPLAANVALVHTDVAVDKGHVLLHALR